MAALYTVPTTARYQSADGKDVRQFIVGDLIDVTTPLDHVVVEDGIGDNSPRSIQGLLGKRMRSPATLAAEGRAPARVLPKEDEVHLYKDTRNVLLGTGFGAETPNVSVCQGAAPEGDQRVFLPVGTMNYTTKTTPIPLSPSSGSPIGG